jgi:hypothetical protein
MSEFSPASDEQFALVDRLFEELMVKHFEMAQLVEQYRELVESLQHSAWDIERRKLAGALPGARYHVAMTFAREQGLKIEAELKKMFPRE